MAERESAKLGFLEGYQGSHSLKLPYKNGYFFLPRVTGVHQRLSSKWVPDWVPETDMGAEKQLSEARCKAAKPQQKVYYLNDGGGLRLRVRPNGSRHWIYRYRFAKKEHNASLGPYPSVSLRDARQKLYSLKAQVRDGHDPVVLKRIRRTQQVSLDESSFGAVAAAWLAHNKASWSSHHYERNEGLVRRYLLPELRDLPIDAIEEPFLFSVLKKLYDRGIKESARRTRAVAAQIFSFGRATHKCSRNPAREMVDNPYFKKPPVRHFTALPQSEVAGLVRKLSLRGAEQRLSLQTVCGLLMVLYTGLREASVRAARWGEIDFEKGQWTVPASRMKSRRQHVVPMPSQLIDILQELEPLTFAGSNSLILTGRGQEGFLAENTLRMALHRLGHRVTVHGMRSLLTDVLSENGFSPDWIEIQLDHQERNRVRAAYLRTKFIDQRTVMMQWFADWCESSGTEKQHANVVKMVGRDER